MPKKDALMRRYELLLSQGIAVVLLFALSGRGVAADDLTPSDCMDCHVGDEDVPAVNLKRYTASVHGVAGLNCTDCHSNIGSLPHDDVLAKVSCAECHDDAAETLGRGVHGALAAAQRGEAPVACSACHGVHDIRAIKDPESLVGPRHMAQTCIACHDDDALQSGAASSTNLMQSYLLSVHGHASVNDPSTPVATCSDCHDGHETQPVDALNARVSRANVAKTCTACHADVGEVYFASVHGALAAQGRPDVAVCTDCHGEHNIRSHQDRLSTVSPSQIAETCANCHEDPEILSRHKIDIMSPSTLYRNSIHGRALLEDGNTRAAACQDCHGSHSILGGHDARSTVHREHIAKTCGRCHETERDDYEQSIHAQALSRGVTESAVCTDCHGEHTILGHLDPSSPVYATRLAKEVCGRCHDSMVINRKFGLPPMQVATYNQSYHGLASRLGDTKVANCASCHEAHRILPSHDPASSVHPGNMQKTCGSCHPGATEKFVGGIVHVSATSPQHSVVFWVRRVYIFVILASIGFMIVHNVIIVAAHLREKYAKQKRMPYVQRFPKTVIAQHMLLTITFITLVITGFSLSFPDSFFSAVLRDWLELGEVMRSRVHRIAAVGMTLTMVWHLISLFCTQRGRQELKALALRPRDGWDMFLNLLHHLGFKVKRPRFDRYDYSEKIEYWALMWGTGVMVATGLMMWFPFAISDWLGLSKAWVDVAEVIHYYEAWLAALAIIVWHMFFVVYHPEEYPMSMSWLTGKLPLEAMEERHPAELERLQAAGEVHAPEMPPEVADETKP